MIRPPLLQSHQKRTGSVSIHRKGTLSTKMSKVPEELPLPLMDISKLKNEARSDSKQSSIFKINRKISTAGIESILLLKTKIMGLRTNGLLYISKYKCSGPPAFKSRRNKTLYHSNQELMHRYQLAKNQLWDTCKNTTK